MLAFAEALYQSPLSLFLQRGASWLIPTTQSIHILAIAVVLSSVLMTNLRVLRLAGTAHSIEQITKRYLPWIWWGLLVLLMTGLVLILLEPARALVNVSFWLKMALLVLAVVATYGFQAHARAHPNQWERPWGRRHLVISFVAGSFFVWCAIVFAGRWIGYS